MSLSVFRRENWKQNVGVLDESAVKDRRVFSHFDNTFPQLKIFSRAFAYSTAYFNADPLSVCLSSVREWAPMSHLVQSVRLVEALGEYRKNGLPFMRYIMCKNFALSRFMPALVWMIINREHSGYTYINPLKLILANCLYPNFYLSTFTYLFRQVKKRWRKINSM